MKSFLFITLVSLSLFTVLSTSVVYAEEGGSLAVGAREENILTTVFTDNGRLFSQVAYAWTSFVAAVVIFVLVFKFMVGGQLAGPITIIGFGALANSFIGFVPIVLEVYMEKVVSPALETELLWFGSLVFHLSVILGVFGIAKVFGLLRAK